MLLCDVCHQAPAAFIPEIGRYSGQRFCLSCWASMFCVHCRRTLAVVMGYFPGQIWSGQHSGGFCLRCWEQVRELIFCQRCRQAPVEIYEYDSGRGTRSGRCLPCWEMDHPPIPTYKVKLICSDCKAIADITINSEVPADLADLSPWERGRAMAPVLCQFCAQKPENAGRPSAAHVWKLAGRILPIRRSNTRPSYEIKLTCSECGATACVEVIGETPAQYVGLTPEQRGRYAKNVLCPSCAGKPKNAN